MRVARFKKPGTSGCNSAAKSAVFFNGHPIPCGEVTQTFCFAALNDSSDVHSVATSNAIRLMVRQPLVAMAAIAIDPGRRSWPSRHFACPGLQCFAALLSAQLSLGDELDDLQGTWEMVQSQNGVEQRVTKTIKDRTETVEVFVNGVLTQKHEVEIAIETFGPVKVFLWKNGQIIGGPNKGKKLPDAKSIFRLEDKNGLQSMECCEMIKMV